MVVTRSQNQLQSTHQIPQKASVQNNTNRNACPIRFLYIEPNIELHIGTKASGSNLKEAVKKMKKNTGLNFHNVLPVYSNMHGGMSMVPIPNHNELEKYFKKKMKSDAAEFKKLSQKTGLKKEQITAWIGIRTELQKLDDEDTSWKKTRYSTRQNTNYHVAQKATRRHCQLSGCGCQ